MTRVPIWKTSIAHADQVTTARAVTATRVSTLVPSQSPAPIPAATLASITAAIACIVVRRSASMPSYMPASIIAAPSSRYAKSPMGTLYAPRERQWPRGTASAASPGPVCTESGLAGPDLSVPAFGSPSGSPSDGRGWPPVDVEDRPERLVVDPPVLAERAAKDASWTAPILRSAALPRPLPSCRTRLEPLHADGAEREVQRVGGPFQEQIRFPRTAGPARNPIPRWRSGVEGPQLEHPYWPLHAPRHHAQAHVRALLALLVRPGDEPLEAFEVVGGGERNRTTSSVGQHGSAASRHRSSRSARSVSFRRRSSAAPAASRGRPDRD